MGELSKDKARDKTSKTKLYNYVTRPFCSKSILIRMDECLIAIMFLGKAPKERAKVPKRMNFRKSSEGGGAVGSFHHDASIVHSAA